MVCYFILHHICMLGSHRPVQRQVRKPGASSPTRRRLGRGGGRRQIAKCSLSPAVLPDLATGTTARRHYRSCYRHQQTTPTEAKYSLSPAVLPDLDPVL